MPSGNPKTRYSSAIVTRYNDIDGSSSCVEEALGRCCPMLAAIRANTDHGATESNEQFRNRPSPSGLQLSYRSREAPRRSRDEFCPSDQNRPARTGPPRNLTETAEGPGATAQLALSQSVSEPAIDWLQHVIEYGFFARDDARLDGHPRKDRVTVWIVAKVAAL